MQADPRQEPDPREWSHPRYATALTGAAYNLLSAIEHGDRANVHGWSVALRKELDGYLAGQPPEAAQPVEQGLDVERLRAAIANLDGGADGNYRWTFTMESTDDLADQIAAEYARLALLRGSESPKPADPTPASE